MAKVFIFRMVIISIICFLHVGGEGNSWGRPGLLPARENQREDSMKTILLAALLLSPSAFAAQVEWKSVYTDLKKDCVVVSSANDQAEIDFFEAECKSFGGYRLMHSGGDIRYAPVLSFNGVELEIGRPFSFHDTASDKVEWIYRHTTESDGGGQIEWKGFVYRLSVASAEGISDQNVLFAVRLDGENSCLLGKPKTNAEARALVQNLNAPCVKN
jgi:hypothetical protein